MKIIYKAIILLFLAVVLASCRPSAVTPVIKATDLMETSMAMVKTEIVGTLMADATLSPSILQRSATPTETPIPLILSSPIPVSGIPTTLPIGNGLVWTECVIPNGEYFHTKPDMEVLSSCIPFPDWQAEDEKRRGERISGRNGSDLRLVIGGEVFLAKHDSTDGCCKYEFLKNGEVIRKTHASLITFDPNRNLWNIGGKVVWELIADPPVIIMDNVNLNEKYQLDGSFFPYEIDGKLIFIARKNGKFHLMYDGKFIGPELDEISMAYCCAKMSVSYGNGQYWFIGSRQGTQFVVLIH